MKHMLDIQFSDPMSINLSPPPPAHRPSLPQYYLESRRVHDEREGKEAAAPAASVGPGAQTASGGAAAAAGQRRDPFAARG
jgi:hypothetical protein